MAKLCINLLRLWTLPQQIESSYWKIRRHLILLWSLHCSYKMLIIIFFRKAKQNVPLCFVGSKVNWSAATLKNLYEAMESSSSGGRRWCWCKHEETNTEQKNKTERYSFFSWILEKNKKNISTNKRNKGKQHK